MTTIPHKMRVALVALARAKDRRDFLGECLGGVNGVDTSKEGLWDALVEEFWKESNKIADLEDKLETDLEWK